MISDPIFPPIEDEPSRWRLGGNVIVRGQGLKLVTAAFRGRTLPYRTSREFGLRLAATLPPCNVAGSVVE